MSFGLRALRTALLIGAAVSMVDIATIDFAFAQNADLGSVTVAAAPKPAARKKVKVRSAAPRGRATQAAPRLADRSAQPVVQGLPLASPNAVGSAAAPGTAPALAVAQSALNIVQPTTIVSDKVLRDVLRPGTDFTEAVKLTPSVTTANSNGMQETKVSVRGFQDGEFNVTFDGVPFQDVNSLTHHSTSYFTGWEFGKIILDRGPGYADTLGYSTFGGTLALYSKMLKDKPGGMAEVAYGTGNTRTFNAEVQSGIIPSTGGRVMATYSRTSTDGLLKYGNIGGDYASIELEQPLGDRFTMTAFASWSHVAYNNLSGITRGETTLYGKDYGRLSGDPTKQNFWGYNHRVKTTDFEYIKLDGDLGFVKLENTAYSYFYTNFEHDGKSLDITAANGISYKKASDNTSFTFSATDVPGFTQLNAYRAVGDTLRLSHDFKDLGFMSGKLVGGMWFETQNNPRNQHNMDLTTGVYYDALTPAASYLTAWNYQLVSRMSTFQPFIQYEWRPFDRLTITPGFKQISFQRHEIAPMEQTTQLPMDTKANYHANLGFFSANYRLTDQISLYGQWAQGFLAPNVNILYVPDPSKNSAQPQRSTNYQLGAVYKSANLTVDGDIYWIDFTNKIASFTCGVQTCFQNIGGVTYKGIEGTATWAFGNGFAIAGGGSLNSAKTTTDHLWIGNAPNYTGFGAVIYDDPSGLFGSVTSKWTGVKYAGAGQILTTTANRIDGWNQTDAVIGYRLPTAWTQGMKVKIRAGVNNIFDVRPIIDESATFNGAKTDLDYTKSTFSYNGGRTVFLSLTGEY